MNLSLSILPVSFAVPVPANIESLTLRAVRPISIIGSIEISTPASATGRFKVDNTRIDAKVAPPPTTPNELIITTPINVRTNGKSISTFATGYHNG